MPPPAYPAQPQFPEPYNQIPKQPDFDDIQARLNDLKKL